MISIRPRRIRVSKIATPVFTPEAHTVFCTPDTDDWTGGVTRLEPSDFGSLRQSSRPDPDNLNTKCVAVHTQVDNYANAFASGG
jgi:hypothetical protein